MHLWKREGNRRKDRQKDNYYLRKRKTADETQEQPDVIKPICVLS